MFAKWIEADGRYAFSETDNGGLEISADEHIALLDGQGRGLRIIEGDDGRPVLSQGGEVDQEIIKKAQAMRRDAMMASAGRRMGPLQDAVDLGIATAAEAELLEDLKRYRVALSRLDMDADQIDWPIEP
ncbi:tail fiber assembly protein [Cupriavidus gilardii]|uniref:tail fiber assembly protein n=1 Tax=Cupriavidus gilardii TaxID=82541 RepID=UPI001ABDD47A|nr:tail fiber assembly protein [Cupriavidus gilardii]MBO4120297.1 tail fiber assembly protein [Cupriavidus gilardii]